MTVHCCGWWWIHGSFKGIWLQLQITAFCFYYPTFVLVTCPEMQIDRLIHRTKPNPLTHTHNHTHNHTHTQSHTSSQSSTKMLPIDFKHHCDGLGVDDVKHYLLHTFVLSSRGRVNTIAFGHNNSQAGLQLPGHTWMHVPGLSCELVVYYLYPKMLLIGANLVVAWLESSYA